ncbi:MAG TPA: crosslink repair DNA glycosylase YcaQ family protein [Steroidobacteraceae bacterium]|jgi:hypothetical protein
MPLSLEHLRRYAIARSLFKPTTLKRAIGKLGFVQADPIRAPARAQDLTLRHRVIGYRAGDLERRYARLGVEEDFFVNYGFLPRAVQSLMHPRIARHKWTKTSMRNAQAVLEFVRRRRVAHPRAVDAQFAHGKVQNWFGGSSNASTQLLDAMHYRGLLRVARREGGTRVYAAREPAAAGAFDPDQRLDTLVDLVAAKYAPLPARTLSDLVYRLRIAAPQWEKRRRAALARARERLASAQVNGVLWYWPAGERPQGRRWRLDEEVRLLTPFDPIVWDRRRFEIFWGWPYRFEAYTPAKKRKLGYYALPLLWHDQVIGWGNVGVKHGVVHTAFGYVSGKPPAAADFNRALEAEIERLRAFLKGSADSDA